MTTSGGRPGRGRPWSRSNLDDKERRTSRKKAQARRQAGDGVANGLVEIPGPLPETLEREVRAIVAASERREKARDPAAAVLRITPFEQGLAVETESEKLAQHIADALARSHKAEVDRTFDDEGKRRILTCRFPGGKA
jgi:hypothetical protein